MMATILGLLASTDALANEVPTTREAVIAFFANFVVFFIKCLRCRMRLMLMKTRSIKGDSDYYVFQ